MLLHTYLIFKYTFYILCNIRSSSGRDQPGSRVYIALIPNVNEMKAGIKSVISGLDETICEYKQTTIQSHSTQKQQQ